MFRSSPDQGPEGRCRSSVIKGTVASLSNSQAKSIEARILSTRPRNNAVAHFLIPEDLYIY